MVFASKRNRLCFVVIVGLGLPIFVGCDPVRTVTQKVHLRILDIVSNRPVAGARIHAKADFERKDNSFKNTQMSSRELDQHQREFWERKPWHSGITDDAGLAKFEIVETALDRSSGDIPPASRDLLSGRIYIVKVSQDNPTLEEELRIKIEPGAKVVGDRFSVTVVDIGKPLYAAE